MGCEPFQIAVERGLHGALPDREREALARHLAGCEACRAYEAAAREAEEAMAANAEEALRGVDWGRVERGIREGIWSAMRGLVAAVLGGAGIALLLWWTSSPAFRAERMLRAAAALGVGVSLVAAVLGVAAWRLQRLARGPEMLATYRDGVRARVAIGRWLPRATLPLAGWLAWLGATRETERVNAPVYYGVLAVVVAGAGLYARWVKLPAARRELAELERDGQG